MLAWADAGSKACGAVSSQANRPSIAPNTHDSTHTVMASGVHTSSPASRNFFTPLRVWMAEACQAPALPPWGLQRAWRGAAAPAALGSDLASVLVSVLSAGLASGSSDLAGVPPRKSVAYHPEPFN